MRGQVWERDFPTPLLEEHRDSLFRKLSMEECGGLSFVRLALLADAVTAGGSEEDQSSSSSAAAAEAAQEVAWEQLHSGPWHAVPIVWRDAYSFTSLLIAKQRVAAGDRQGAMRTLDLGIMKGGPLLRQDLESAISFIRTTASDSCSDSLDYENSFRGDRNESGGRAGISGSEEEESSAITEAYHPDVSKEIEAGKIFKSINSAYKVLSNEKTRAVYDRKLELLQNRASIKPLRQWAHQEYEVDQTMRVYRWSELKRQRHRQWHYYDERSRSSARKAKKVDGFKVGSFTDMLKHALFVLSIILVLGHRTGLLLHGLIAILDEELDSGYKLGYVIASLLGGRGGVFLTFSLLFLSRLFGKTSSGAIASALATIYVGVDIGRFVPFPRGALLALVYMTMKLQAI